jgi:dienelactone hydrolase
MSPADPRQGEDETQTYFTLSQGERSAGARFAAGNIVAGRFRIVRYLARGGMGEVYEAYDQELDAAVALKTILPEVVRVDSVVSRFKQEIALARKVTHPNVCRVFDLFYHRENGNEVAFLSMELVRGETLRERIRRQVRFHLAEALPLIKQMVAALEAAHSIGVIHRDFKSMNVMLEDRADGSTRAVVTDFGLARSIEGASSATASVAGALLGTPDYMAPEQVQGGRVSTAADIYALGVVLYQMATGALPYSGDTPMAVATQKLQSPPAPPRKYTPQLEERWEKVILKCLERDPAKRFPTAAAALEAIDPQPKVEAVAERARWRWWAAAMVVVLLGSVVFFGVQEVKRRAGDRVRAHVERLTAEGKFTDAFLAALEAPEAVTKKQWDAFSVSFALDIEPHGHQAEAWWKPYRTPEAPWQKVEAVGQEIRWLIEPVRLKIVMPGFQEQELMLATYPRSPQGKRTFRMYPKQSEIPGMIEHVVLFNEGAVDFRVTGLRRRFGKLGKFWVDRYETSNREYQKFVDAGGYARREFWTEKFVERGKGLSWEEAMERFRDKTGRPGPAVWEAGTYPKGKEDHPVAGVSWYEALAFAKFAGKSLPTYFHWYILGGPFYSYAVAPLANTASSGTVPVGSRQALGMIGTQDQAGNVREWVWNDTGEGEKYAPGGAWDDDPLAMEQAYSMDPFDRSPGNGFRCIKDETPLGKDLYEPILRVIPRDYSKIKPLPPETLAAYQSMFRNNAGRAEGRTEGVDDSSEYWRKERVTYSTPYSAERMPAYLFLPKSAKPPFQTVIWYPWATGLNAPSSQYLLNMEFLDFVIKSGRAVLYPIYAGHYERKMPGVSGRDFLIMRAREVSRSIDYLEERPETASGKYAYYGASAGGVQAPFLGIEPRLKAVVVTDWGFPLEQPGSPEVDPVYFAPAMKAPFLLINGRFDHWNPPAVRDPVVRYFGARPEDKRHIVLNTSHFAISDKDNLIREVLGWLDKYLGKVQ